MNYLKDLQDFTIFIILRGSIDPASCFCQVAPSPTASFYFPMSQVFVSLSSLIPLTFFFPPFHPSIHQPMAWWLLPISAKDPWRGLEQGCAPVGYWTQLTVKANGLWGGGWICHHWLVLFTNEGRGDIEEKRRQTLRDYVLLHMDVKLATAEYWNVSISQQWRIQYCRQEGRKDSVAPINLSTNKVQ